MKHEPKNEQDFGAASSNVAPTTRRRFVVDALGGAAGVALLGACGGNESADDSGSAGSAGNAGTGGGGSGGQAGSAGNASGGTGGGSAGSAGSSGTGGSPEAGTCTLYPQQTQGPFYLDLDLLRSDITEGKPGTPLKLEIFIVRASDCTPLEAAAVDIWLCDADGVYSGYPGQLGGLDTTGQRFLRGTQLSDAQGRVVFQSIYPGWYPGRTTHIHFKVHPSPTTEATSQLYFPEQINSAVYQTAPYAARGQKDTTNAADITAQSGGMPALLEVTPVAAGYEARLTVAVNG